MTAQSQPYIYKKTTCTSRKNYRSGERRSGANGIRTSDTRIFSPMLYQLSYGTPFLFARRIVIS